MQANRRSEKRGDDAKRDKGHSAQHQYLLEHDATGRRKRHMGLYDARAALKSSPSCVAHMWPHPWHRQYWIPGERS
jgi:hypothetical protein